jgi:hypothetical protein
MLSAIIGKFGQKIAGDFTRRRNIVAMGRLRVAVKRESQTMKDGAAEAARIARKEKGKRKAG